VDSFWIAILLALTTTPQSPIFVRDYQKYSKRYGCDE